MTEPVEPIVEHVDEMYGSQRIVGTVTYLCDPEAERRANAIYCRAILESVPRMLEDIRRELAESQDPSKLNGGGEVD
jgi:hypothetical protein